MTNLSVIISFRLSSFGLLDNGSCRTLTLNTSPPEGSTSSWPDWFLNFNQHSYVREEEIYVSDHIEHSLFFWWVMIIFMNRILAVKYLHNHKTENSEEKKLPSRFLWKQVFGEAMKKSLVSSTLHAFVNLMPYNITRNTYIPNQAHACSVRSVYGAKSIFWYFFFIKKILFSVSLTFFSFLRR